MANGATVRALVAIVATVFFVGSWIQTGSPATSLLSFFSTAVLAVTIILALWDRWLWKTRLAQKVPSVPRDISGTWESRLESFWVDPKTGKSPDPKTVYIVIRQTSSRVAVTLISDESKSRSSLARITKEDEVWTLHYIYTNESHLELRPDSPIHHGSGVFTATGDPVKRLNGSYWTDRDSKGRLTLNRRHKHLAGDFEDGKELFGQT